MKKSFTKSKLNKEDTTKMQEPRIRVVEESPDFLVPGLVYAQGSLKTNDLVFQDTRGNKFTYIPKDNECESYWVSTYEISQDNKTGEARSISGVFPWVKITPRDALEVAKAFGGFLLLFEQIERLWRYMVKTRVATYMQIYSDSSSLGNY